MYIYYTILRESVSTLSVKNLNLEVFRLVPILSDSYHCIIYDFRNQTELVGSFCGDLDYITL